MDITIRARRRRPAHTRAVDIAVFATVSLVIIDLALTAIALTPNRLRPEAMALLDGWDILKAGLAALVLWLVAVRLESRVPALFGVIILAIALQDETGWHFPLARFVVERMDMPATVGDIPTEALVQAVILTQLAGIFAAALWIFKSSSERIKSLQRNLFLLLALMFCFAVVVDLLTDVTGSSWVENIEETGERLTLSLIVGYATWYRAQRFAAGEQTVR